MVSRILDLFRGKVLFSMTTRQLGKSPNVIGSAHYNKHTHYTVDREFAEHLKVCPVCREQLLESLRETHAMIDSGEFWK
jgi:hypothetical protein